MKKLLSLPVIVLTLTILILQYSCMKDSDEKQNPDVTASADTIFGVVKYKQVVDGVTSVVSWPYGIAAIKAVEVGNEIVASATVTADGTFMLILPATVKGNYFIRYSESYS
jgi:hypothetical protein